MYFRPKQRYDFSIAGFVPAMICVSIVALAWLIAGQREAIASAAAFFILYAAFSAWIYSRTGNQSYIAASLFQLFFGLYLFTQPEFSLLGRLNPAISGVILVLCLLSTVWLFYLFFRRKAKWKGREVFELASVAADVVPEGFTARPRPAGIAEYTKDDLTGFARFLSSNLIAMPSVQDDRIVFVPVKMDDSFSYLFNPGKFTATRSWVAFSYNGEVTVNISRKDYLSYKEELSFDQLCDNLGSLFIRFMGYYRKGEQDRILYELNDVGLGLQT